MQFMIAQRRAALSVAVALIVVFATVLIRMGGMAPKPANAPAGEFSAVRALDAERATIGGKIPHPTGSAAIAAVRDRIVARLQTLGYETNVKRSFTCNAHGECATVENIIARAAGEPAGPPVILCAHYDSVNAGPGASDDGAGVATVLEIARAIRTQHFRNPIVLLIDDGEEAGLLGAEAFVADRAASDISPAVVNLEARGTGGSSFLFETSANNRWFIPIVAKALPRPITTSLFFSIYELLPNDTDLTVFKRAGLTGVNFAFLRNVVFYHSPFDDIDHVELRTLQQHGENALAALRALGNADLRPQGSGNAVWFDVLGSFVIWWPARWTLIIAIASLVLSIVAAAILVREAQTSVSEIGIGIGAVLVAIVATVLIAIVAMFATPSAKWLAHPLAAIAAAWIIGIVVVFVVLVFSRRAARFDSLFVANAIVWNALAIVVTLLLTGASYGFLVPGIVLAVGAMLRATGNGDEIVLAVIAAVFAAIVWFPFGTTLYDALGRASIVVIALLIGLVATTFAPLFERISRPFVVGGAALLAVCLALTIALPATTAERPRRLTLSYLDDGASSRWLASAPLPNATHRERMFPWFGAVDFYTATAPRLPLAPVLISREGTAIRVRSQRNADRVTLIIHAAVPLLRINGVVPPPRSARFQSDVAPGWTRVYSYGSEIVVDVGTTNPVEVYAADSTLGLPPEAQSLVDARHAANAFTSDSGDTTVTMRHTTL
jgi:peptidase M28-like protein